MLSYPCDFRGAVIGTVECGCSGKPKIYACAHSSVARRYCFVSTPGKPVRKLKFTDGAELAYTLADKAADPVSICATCPHRVVATPITATVAQSEQSSVAARTVDGRNNLLRAPVRRAIHSNLIRPASNLVTEAPRILLCLPAPDWQAQLIRADFALTGASVAVQLSEIVRPDYRQLVKAVVDVNPAIVVAHGFSTRSRDIVKLASWRPRTVFVIVDHSSLNHTFTWPQYFDDYKIALDGSERLPNLYVAAVDRHADWAALGYSRYFRWYNPLLAISPEGRTRPAVDTVGITSRADWMKALPAQIMAAALLQRRRRIDCWISLSGDAKRLAAMQTHAAACRLDCSFVPYLARAGFYARLLAETTVVFQPSMSDSMNIISAEGAMCGVPFVGSRTIPHTPRQWCVNDPNDPTEIANVAEYILDNYEEQAALALQLSAELLADNNERFVTIIRELLAWQKK